MNEILKGIELAIDEEIAAQKTYQNLKEEAESEKAKALFEQLVKDEKAHEKLLRSRYQALKENLEL